MCDNKECPVRLNCYRFTATPNEYRQSYCNFSHKTDSKLEGCSYFWDNKNKDENR